MARGYGNYQYETSPRKIQTEYIPNKQKNSKAKKKQTKQVKKQVKENVKVAKKEKTVKRKAIAYVAIAFAALLVISYRNSQITEQFTEVKNLKSNLAAVEKENEQLEVNIESSINLSKIEKEAAEQLGMQKLDNAQKVYISLPKKDYVEPATEDVIENENSNWFENIINILLGK